MGRLDFSFKTQYVNIERLSITGPWYDEHAVPMEMGQAGAESCFFPSKSHLKRTTLQFQILISQGSSWRFSSSSMLTACFLSLHLTTMTCRLQDSRPVKEDSGKEVWIGSQLNKEPKVKDSNKESEEDGQLPSGQRDGVMTFFSTGK